MKKNELNCSDVFGPNVPGLFLLVCETKKDGVIGYRIRESGDSATVRYIRGRTCETRETNFQEWGAALQFPDYFNFNHDSFEECLQDVFDWTSVDNLLVLVTNSEKLLSSSPDQLQVLLDILSDTVDYHKSNGSSPPKSLKVCLQAEEDRFGELIDKIRSSGHEIPEVYTLSE